MVDEIVKIAMVAVTKARLQTLELVERAADEADREAVMRACGRVRDSVIRTARDQGYAE